MQLYPFSPADFRTTAVSGSSPGTGKFSTVSEGVLYLLFLLLPTSNWLQPTELRKAVPTLAPY